jgi:D-alanyl-lipoteichoic acid acyltransferase DltB (MBOAT superfamily)
VVFTSLDYALLLLLTFTAYWGLPNRWSSGVLVAASLLFYAFWSVPFLGLLLGCIALGYAAGRFLEEGRGRRVRARAGGVAVVGALLGVLGVFKYSGLIGQAWQALGGAALDPAPAVLPLAISFYVFQILGYVIDVWRGRAAERSPLRFTLFVSFFPQLIAGPIARGHQLLPQLRRRGVFDATRTLRGVELIAYGVVKKTVFADNLAVYVDRIYASPQLAGGVDVVVATLAFGAQIYCDFSGYTDIARGSGRILGIELPENFRSPYAATSLRDFWRRWHITLSTWLRDYLFIPLGGSRGAAARTAANLLITMILGGLWHGAGVTFVLWGAYHGLLLVAERALGAGARSAPGASRPMLGMILTFVAVQVGWLVFRAEDTQTLVALVGAVSERPLGIWPPFDTLTYWPLVAGSYALHTASAWIRSRWEVSGWGDRIGVAAPALAACILLVVIFGGSSDAFIYFQF